MTRKTIDCRTVPNDVGCTLAITGEPGELVAAAAQHAMTVHGHADTPELREALRGLLSQSIIDRKKKGFGIPAAQWLKTTPAEPPLTPVPGVRRVAGAVSLQRPRARSMTSCSR